MKKYICRILVIAFLMFLSFSDIHVEAMVIDTNIGSGSGSGYTQCGSGSVLCYSSLPSQSLGVRIQAIRVSIVDQNGNRWPGTKSLDYFKYDDETSKKVFEYLKQRAPVNFYKQLYTKNEILQNLNTNLNRSTITDYTQRKEIVMLTENAFKTFHGPQSVPGALRKYFLEEITEEYFIEMYLEKLGFNYEEEVKKLANDPDYFKNIYLLVEPIAYFRINSYRGGNLNFRITYVGTITEVAHMMTKDKDVGYTGSDNFFGLVHPTQTYRGSNFGRTPMGDAYPLAIYVDVNSSMTVAGLKGVRDIVAGLPDKTNIADKILTNFGFGAGHVRFDEIIKSVCPAPDKITQNELPRCCEDWVQGNYNLNNSNLYPKCCDELYEAGKLNSNHLPVCCKSLPKSDPLYQRYCEEKIDCWTLDISCPDNCDNITEGLVKDIGETDEEWQCIFDSLKSSRQNIREHYFATDFESRPSGNPYCDYYCREEISYQLPPSGFSTLAGHHFTVGKNSSQSWKPILFEGHVECRTNGIDYQKFRRDYDYYDSRMVYWWDKYQEALLHNDSVRGRECSDKPDCGRKVCPVPERERCSTDKETGEEKCRSYCPTSKVYIDYTCEGADITSADYGTINAGKWCDQYGHPYKDTSTPYQNYIEAKEARDQSYEWIVECNNWWRDYSYFQPRVYLDFEEEYYGFKALELKEVLDESKYTKRYYVGDSYSTNIWKSTDETTKHDCYRKGYNCSSYKITYPTNENVRQYITRAYRYELPSNLYRYITKPGGFSVSEKPLYGEYVDIGYANLPIHYSRAEGLYDLSLWYTTFGDDHKFDQYVFDGISFTGNYNNHVKCKSYYKCEYNVKNFFMSDREELKKLNVVFRQISLTDPFPGEDGRGRRAGSNWRGNESLITRNRGLSNPERIYYDTEPMYVIELTPFDIIRIRRYNRTAVEGGYGDFNLTCIKGTGEQCKSEFIRKTFDDIFIGGCALSSDWDACD